MRETNGRRPTIMSLVLAGRMPQLRANARVAAPVLKAMGNPSRLMILCRVAEGECSVGEIEEVAWFAPDALPDGITPGTRARITEALHGGDPHPHW